MRSERPEHRNLKWEGLIAWQEVRISANSREKTATMAVARASCAPARRDWDCYVAPGARMKRTGRLACLGARLAVHRLYTVTSWFVSSTVSWEGCGMPGLNHKVEINYDKLRELCLHRVLEKDSEKEG